MITKNGVMVGAVKEEFKQKNREEKIPIPAYFDDSVLDCIEPNISRHFVEGILRVLADVKPEEIRDRIDEFVGKEADIEQLKRVFSFPERKIQAEVILASEKLWFECDHGLQIIAILYQLSEQGRKFAGYVDMNFLLVNGEPQLHIRRRRLANQGEGLGLDLECQIEALYRECNVRVITNEAITQSSDDPLNRDIGGYVWALYGYEFQDGKEALELQQSLIEFAKANNIEILGDASALRRPIEFAKLLGKNEKGETVRLGKRFLLECNVFWHGKRDLAMNSEGTHDLVAYLKQRGRDDLIGKFFPRRRP